MKSVVRHWHYRDLLFVGLIGIDLLLIGLYLASGSLSAGKEGERWRRIDTAAVQQRIDAGSLSDHDADWYHVEQGDIAGDEVKRP